MDSFRRRLIPDSPHHHEHIDIAYRAMHYAADLLLEQGMSIMVDSTYSRSEQRREIESIAVRTGARLVPIQCRVPPAVAVNRFRRRSTDHPALDLDERRVARLAAEYPYLDSCLLVDTTGSIASCLLLVDHYLSTAREAKDGEWFGGVWTLPGSDPSFIRSRLATDAREGRGRSRVDIFRSLPTPGG
jgi:hypothetical protein